MAETLESVNQFPNSPIPAAAITVKIGSLLVPPALDPAQNPASEARCLWCQRTFAARTTGGSSQKFCCTGHRQQFWIAARRWTMRAIEAGAGGAAPSGRLPKGISPERARCLRGHSDLT